MSRPKVNTRAVADRYSQRSEKIIEVTNGARSAEEHKGALIALRSMPDGTFRIEVYRADPGVTVSFPPSMGGLEALASAWAQSGSPNHPFAAFPGTASHHCQVCGATAAGVQHQ